MQNWDNFWKSKKIIYKPISIFKNLYLIRIKAEYIKKFLSKSYILEVGCGDGKLLSLLSKENKIVGIDISREAIKKARKNLINKNVSLKLGNAFNLDFNSNMFDLVLCDGLIEHYTDRIDTLIKEMYRVTKKGGRVIIILTNNDFIRNILFSFVYKWDKKKIKTTKEYKKTFNKIFSKTSDYRIEIIPKSLGILVTAVVKKC